jgi:hypothetical protein
MQTIAAREISLYELEQRFGLQAIDREFIAALTETAVMLTPEEQKTLDRIRHNYQNLLRYGNLSEESVKMVVLSYLLDLAGFYESPCRMVIKSEGTLFDVMSALPQLLSDMLANPDKLGVTYGLLMNGREFAFVELEASRYSVSQTFSINKPVTDLPIVLQVLKQIRDRIVK